MSQNFQPVIQKLFNSILLNQQMIQLISNDQIQQLVVLLAKCGNKILVKINQLDNNFNIFLSNYRKLIIVTSQNYQSSILNNISLHFILISSYVFINQGNQKQARIILKKSLNYIESYQPDNLLLSIALNNLSILYLTKNKYFKSISCSIKVIKIMQKHMNQLKKNKLKKKLVQDSVILINSMIICRETFIQINKDNLLSQNKNKFKEIVAVINDAGYRCAVKYLGKSSILTQKLSQINDEHYLPVYYRLEQEQTISQFEQQIISKLESIEDLLRNKLQTNIIIERSLIKNQSRQNQPEQKSQLPIKKIVYKSQQLLLQIQQNVYQKQQIHLEGLQQQVNHQSEIENQQYQQILSINQCQILISIDFRQNSKLQLQRMKIKIIKEKKNIRKVLTIQNQQLQTLVKQLRWLHYLPWQYTLQNISKKQLSNKLIASHLNFKQERQIIFCTHKPALIQPIIVNFLNNQSLIFLQYIKYKLLRITISPKNSAQEILIDLQLRDQTLNNYLQIPKNSNQFTLQLYTILKNQCRKQQQNSQQNIKQIKVIDGSRLLDKLLNILLNFQQFIKSQQQQICLSNIFQNSNRYFKFKQISNKGGIFYNITYLTSLNAYDIFIRNNYLTQAVQGLHYARGRTIYYNSQFCRTFGLNLEAVAQQNMIRLFASLISHKYSLKVYHHKFTTQNRSMYVQNALQDTKITSSSYKVDLAAENNYYDPIVATLLSIENQKPIGIKMTKYNCIDLGQKSFFIHFNSEQWCKQNSTIENRQQIQNIFYKVGEQFVLKNQYFLAEWMQKYGYRLLLKQTIKQQSILYFQNSNFHVFRDNQIRQFYS